MNSSTDSLQVPYDVIDGQVRLRASRCSSCSTVDFPEVEHCSRCGRVSDAPHHLPDTGRLWTWTSQSVRPPSPPYAGGEAPDAYVPFLVGYVQFDEGLCVEGRIAAEGDGAGLTVGRAMQVAEQVVARTSDREDVRSYVFRPYPKDT